MSLINEALRKAQNQRAQSPGLGDSSSTADTPMNYPDSPNRFGLMIGLSVCVILLIGLVAGLTVIILNKDKNPASQETTVNQPPVATPPAPEPATLPQSPEPASGLEPVKPTPAIAATTTEPEAEAPAPETFEKPEEAAEPNQEIVDWLGQSKVTGVRITSSSSKVILNNEAFIPGETVNMNLALKVFTIQENLIIFVDSNGVKYIKNL